jgi:hypothetical protein
VKIFLTCAKRPKNYPFIHKPYTFCVLCVLRGKFLQWTQNLYLASGSVLEVFDISDPCSPSKFTSIAFDSEIATMTLDDTQSYLFVVGLNGIIGMLNTQTLEISYSQFDVLGRISDSASYKNWFIISTSDPVTYQAGSLYLFHIENGNLSLVASFQLGDIPAIEVAHGKIYLVSYDQTLFGYNLRIYELTQPFNLRLLDQYTPASDVPFSDLIITDHFAYLTGIHCELDFCQSSMEVIDISNPLDVKEATQKTGIEHQNSYNVSGWMVIYDGEAYIANLTQHQIEVWNILEPGKWQITRAIRLRN